MREERGTPERVPSRGPRPHAGEGLCRRGQASMPPEGGTGEGRKTHAGARVSLHIGVGHRGPSRQDVRPDLGRGRRRDHRPGGRAGRRRLLHGQGERGGPGICPLRCRDVHHDGTDRGRRRGTHARLRRHPCSRPQDSEGHRLHRCPIRLRLRDLRRSDRDPRAERRHRVGRRRLARVQARRHRPARPDRRGRPGHDVRLRVQRHLHADADADLPGAPARRAPHRHPQGRRAAVPAPRRQDPGDRPLRRRQARGRREDPRSPRSTPPRPTWTPSSVRTSSST